MELSLILKLLADKKNRKMNYSILAEENKKIILIKEEDSEPPIKAIISVQIIAVGQRVPGHALRDRRLIETGIDKNSIFPFK